MTTFIKLEEEDFLKLVSGKVVEKKKIEDDDEGEPIKIILADIGWNRILACVAEAMDKTGGDS